MGQSNRLFVTTTIGYEGNVWAQDRMFVVIKPKDVSVIMNIFIKIGLYTG